MRQKVQYEAVEGFMREAPNGRKAPSLNFMMSWRFCDDRSRSVTQLSHKVTIYKRGWVGMA